MMLPKHTNSMISMFKNVLKILILVCSSKSQFYLKSFHTVIQWSLNCFSLVASHLIILGAL